MLATGSVGRLEEDFAALVATGAGSDLGRAALAIARIEYPALDPDPHLSRLDALAAAARPRLPGGPTAGAALAAHLFGEGGFRGNPEEYYDPRNSFLNDVLERRMGIPVSLAVVLIETGARLGIEVEGVGFPGHFLARVPGAAGPVVLDPFFGGREVGERELLERYRAFLGPSSAACQQVPPQALAATGTLDILARMLRNLLGIYLERADPARAREAVTLLLVLAPDAADETRIRGLLHERLECLGAALEDFRRYLALVPEAPDAEEIRRRVTRLAGTIH